MLVIGSGPIIISRPLNSTTPVRRPANPSKEEGIEVVLINSNPATIMTDGDTADRVYMEPITKDVVKKIIEREKPDGILASFGEPDRLNMAFQLANDGILDRYGIELLGTSLISIKRPRTGTVQGNRNPSTKGFP